MQMQEDGIFKENADGKKIVGDIYYLIIFKYSSLIAPKSIVIKIQPFNSNAYNYKGS